MKGVGMCLNGMLVYFVFFLYFSVLALIRQLRCVTVSIGVV